MGGRADGSGEKGVVQDCGRVAPRLGAELRSNSATGGDWQRGIPDLLPPTDGPRLF